MKLKDLLEQYGEYDVEEWFEIGTDGVADEKGIKLKKPNQKTIWNLEKGDEYVLETDTGHVLSCQLRYVDQYEKSLAVGNVFFTREEAEKDVERRKVEALLLKHGGRRWFKRGEYNCAINLRLLSWDGDGELVINYQIHFAQQGTIYFDTKEQAEKAIKEIGEERIKKALFEVR